MNSLPLISHHLFVAAIGPESRGPEKAGRREKSAATLGGHTTPLALEALDATSPMPNGERLAALQHAFILRLGGGRNESDAQRQDPLLADHGRPGSALSPSG
jgi:hypothetical protein